MAEHHDSWLYFLSREYNWSKGTRRGRSNAPSFFASRVMCKKRTLLAVLKFSPFRLVLYHSLVVNQEIFTLKQPIFILTTVHFCRKSQLQNLGQRKNRWKKDSFTFKSFKNLEKFHEILSYFIFWKYGEPAQNCKQFLVANKIYHWARLPLLFRGDICALSRDFGAATQNGQAVSRQKGRSNSSTGAKLKFLLQYPKVCGIIFLWKLRRKTYHEEKPHKGES